MDRPKNEVNILHPLSTLEWHECSSLPTNMLHPQAAVLDNQVYLGGGIARGMGLSEDAFVYIYDIKKNVWKGIDTPTYHYALATYQSRLVLVGGVDISNHEITNQFWVLGEECTWTEPFPAMLRKCRGASAVSVDSHLVVAGGHDKGALTLVQVFDGSRWSSWKSQCLPCASYWMKSLQHKENWYLAGGRWLDGNVFHTSLKVLISAKSIDKDEKASVWESLPDVPYGYSSLSLLSTELVSIGGEQSASVHAYSSQKRSWVAVGSTPIACDSSCSVSLPNGEVLLVAGEEGSGLASRVFRGAVSAPSFPNGHFSMRALIYLEKTIPVSIFNSLASKYLSLAEMLQFPNHVYNALKEQHKIPDKGCQALFEEWVGCGCSLLPTWSNLFDVLRKLEMGKIADRIERFFSKPFMLNVEEREEGSPIPMSEDVRRVAGGGEEAGGGGGGGDGGGGDGGGGRRREGGGGRGGGGEVGGGEGGGGRGEGGRRGGGEGMRRALSRGGRVVEEGGESFDQIDAEPTTDHRTSVSHCGIEVVAETEFKVHSEGSTLEWKGYGLRLHTPAHTGSEEDHRISVKASLGGQYKLPKDMELLSPVFWISSPSNVNILKSVTMELQHCASRYEVEEEEEEEGDGSMLADLSFVSAKPSPSEDQLPYLFKPQEGGVFTCHSSYGSIQLTQHAHFYGVGVAGRKMTPRCYCAHVFCAGQGSYDWRFYIVITRDLDVQKEIVKKHYCRFARQQTTLRVSFQSREITLDIPEDGIKSCQGWRITPRSCQTISRRDADHFDPDQWIPECELMVEWEEEGEAPGRLRHKVSLVGAKPPNNFLYLTLNPAKEANKAHLGSSLSEHTSDSTPVLKNLLDALYHTAADKWQVLGAHLHIPADTLQTIAARHQRDPQHCLGEVLKAWLNGPDTSNSWGPVINAVESLGEESEEGL